MRDMCLLVKTDPTQASRLIWPLMFWSAETKESVCG